MPCFPPFYVKRRIKFPHFKEGTTKYVKLTNMSEYETKILLGTLLVVIIAVGFAAAAMPVATQSGVGVSTQNQQSSASASTLVILLTLFRPDTVTSLYVFSLLINAAAVGVFSYETLKSLRQKA
jgi:hypothetical protein